jgi:hypothetical protein
VDTAVGEFVDFIGGNQPHTVNQREFRHPARIIALRSPSPG